MDDSRQKYLLVKHPLGYGPKCTLFFVAMFGLSVGQAGPEVARLIRGCWSGRGVSDLGWERAFLILSAASLCFWVSRLSARTVYEVDG